MKIWIRHTVFTVVMLAGVAGVFVLNRLRSEDSREFTCEGISVEMSDSVKFLSPDDIRKRIASGYGDCIGRRVDSVALDRIEKVILSDRTVKECEAWITPDRILHVSVSQRCPAARFAIGNSGFYVDREGVVFPLHPSYTAPVPVICGNLKTDDNGWIDAVAGIADIFATSEEWKESVDTLFIDGRGDIRIRPESSSVTYIFGDTGNVGAKMTRMAIYRDSLSRNGANYTTVNVKYDRSIICK